MNVYLRARNALIGVINMPVERDEPVSESLTRALLAVLDHEELSPEAQAVITASAQFFRNDPAGLRENLELLHDGDSPSVASLSDYVGES